MAFNSGVGSFRSLASDSVGTTYTVTVGFQPKAGIVFWTGRGDTADAVGRLTARAGFGFFTSTTNRYCSVITTADAAAAGSGASGAHNAAVAATVTADSSTFDGLIDVDAILSDGVRFILDDQLPVDMQFGVILYGGSDITNAAVVEFNIGSGTGTVDITSVGFQGNMLFLTGNDAIANAPTADAARIELMFGACTGTGDEHVWWGGSDQASTTMDTGSYSYAGEVMVMAGGAIGSPGSMVNRAEFSSWLSNGFQLNKLETGRNGVRGYALVIAGGSWEVGDFTSRTDTGTIVESSFGFAPKSALVISNLLTQSTQDSFVDHNKLSVGAAAGSNQHAQAYFDEDALTDSEVNNAIDFNKVYINVSASAAVDGLISVQSFDSDGITFNQDDADPSATFSWYVASQGASGSTTYTKTVALTGVVQKQAILKTVAVTGVLQQTFTKTVAVTGVLRQTFTKTAAVTANLSKTFTKTVTVSGQVGEPPQLAYPTVDISAGTWTPSTGSDLYAMVDEVPPVDTDYIQSANTPSNDTCELRFGNTITTPDSDPVVISIRHRIV